MNKMKRVTRKQLILLLQRLSERDHLVLESISKFRYLTTTQIQQLHVKDSVNVSAALRATNRMLVKLRGFGLIVPLKRRIGGVRAGSGSYVWCLTTAGMKLINLKNEGSDETKRKRNVEPSTKFLEHTLAVAEAYVQLTLIQEKNQDVELVKVEVEPDCWRKYVKDYDTVTYLKPDLYVITATGEYEDHWFFEIDLATEAPSRIIRKCKQYYRYFLSGAEQRETGIFPLVVWIVPNVKRATTLQQHVAEEPSLERKNIFLFITPEQLESLICNNTEQS